MWMMVQKLHLLPRIARIALEGEVDVLLLDLVMGLVEMVGVEKGVDEGIVGGVGRKVNSNECITNGWSIKIKM